MDVDVGVRVMNLAVAVGGIGSVAAGAQAASKETKRKNVPRFILDIMSLRGLAVE